MISNDEVGDLHQAAALLVGLQQERTRLQEQELVSAAPASEEATANVKREAAEAASQLRGEAYRLAQELRGVNIIGEIQAAKQKRRGFWARVRILLGWA